MTFDGFSWVALGSVGALTRAFLSGNGEAFAGNLFGEALVHIRHDLLKGCGVEPLGENRSPANDVLSSLHFLGVAVQHFRFNFIPQGFGFRLGFFNQGFQFLQGFDFRMVA